MESPALDISDLGYRYGEHVALDGLCLSLQAGRFLGVLGPNGAGKSTLMALLTRLLEPATGTITVFGQSLQRRPGAALRRMGVVFQQTTLDLDLTVHQNLAYHGALRGMSPRSLRPRIEEQLERFGLVAKRDIRLRSLNGGHRRRVELARAMLHRPAILLLDEPTAGLDPRTRETLRKYVRSLCGDEGLAVLWTTHLLDEVEGDDQVLVLDRGTQLASGSCASLLSSHRAADVPRLFTQLTAALS